MQNALIKPRALSQLSMSFRTEVTRFSEDLAEDAGGLVSFG